MLARQFRYRGIPFCSHWNFYPREQKRRGQNQESLHAPPRWRLMICSMKDVKGRLKSALVRLVSLGGGGSRLSAEATQGKWVSRMGRYLIMTNGAYQNAPGGKPAYAIKECIDLVNAMPVEMRKGGDLYFFAVDLFVKKDCRKALVELGASDLRYGQ